MKIRRFFSRLYRSPEPGEDGGGFEPTESADLTPVAGVETPEATPGTELTPKPATMQEAMFPTVTTPEEKAAADQRARDALGRFAGKPPVDPAAPPVDPLKKPPVDPNAMPEGLAPKAQERFQALVNTNKELAGKLEQATQIAGSPEAVLPMLQSAQAMQTTFRDNGVTREQFEQATSVIGLINRGDMAGAQKVLEDQLRQISLVTGKPIGQVDALASFPDLREAVDNLQIDQERALEIARARTIQQNQQQGAQRQQQQERQQQEVQQAVQQGQLAVDQFCKSKMTSDLDYLRIEPLLLKEVQGGLLVGVPPNLWPRIVEKTYNLIKQTAASARTTQSTQVLRPTGGESPRQAPKSSYEAMWGAPKPAGM
ncbi:hypothetical protein [Rhodoferax koreensis]|nr:hypothetical protein [Rhodoferax koreense]